MKTALRITLVSTIPEKVHYELRLFPDDEKVEIDSLADFLVEIKGYIAASDSMPEIRRRALERTQEIIAILAAMPLRSAE